MVLMELVSHLFGEAWAHRRRRHRTVATGLVLVTLAIVTGVLVGRAVNRSGTQSVGRRAAEPASRVVAAKTVLLIGMPGDHYALAVTVVLKRPATSVVAFLNGRVIALRPFTSTSLRPFTSTVVRHPMTGFTGELRFATTNQVPPIRTALGPLDGPSLNLGVRLVITFGNGSRIETGFRQEFQHT
jgi:hypothetical protein